MEAPCYIQFFMLVEVVNYLIITPLQKIALQK